MAELAPSEVTAGHRNCPVVPVDPHDKAFMADPHPTWTALRADGPVVRSDLYGGFWVVLGYEEASTVLHDPVLFCSGEGIMHPRPPQMPNVVLIETDPPMHQKYRNLLNKHFSLPRAEAQAGAVRELVRGYIDAFIERGEAELVDELARPLPQIILFSLLGVPMEDAPAVMELVHTSTRKYMQDPEAGAKAAAGFYTYLARLVGGRRNRPPQDDVIGAFLEAEIDGEPLSDDEAVRMLMVVFSGGTNTVRGQIAGSLLYLAEHPDQRAWLEEDLSRIPEATEEFLRYVSPIHGLFRTVTAPTELGGRQIAAGDKVWVVHGSANRDERMFEAPQTCVLDRHPNRHMAFGMGIHRCIGSHLARVQVRIALEEILTRLPDYHLDPRSSIEWDIGPGPRGVDRLGVQFTPGERLGP